MCQCAVLCVCLSHRVRYTLNGEKLTNWHDVTLDVIIAKIRFFAPPLRLHDVYLTELSHAFPKGGRLERIMAKLYVWQVMKISDTE